MNKYILLIAAGDAIGLRDRIRDLLTEQGTIRTDPSWFPQDEEAAAPTVALVVMTPQSLADPAVIDFVHEADRRRLPLIPVVEDLAAFSFRTVSIRALYNRNAVGFAPDGRTLLQTVRSYFGLEAFPDKQKVFISYARRDGSEVAQAIYENLWAHKYQAFLDIHQIEKGAVVQERIMGQVNEKDFVLLIDTAAARESDWVRAEIAEAHRQRIQVRVLGVGQTTVCPLVPAVERLTWDETDPERLSKVRSLIARGIGAAASFDQRCRRTLGELAELEGLQLLDRGRRRVLVHSSSKRVLFEYEDSLPSLESLHRLYRSYREEGRCSAVLLCGDHHLGTSTRAAVHWARGRAPLEVCPLVEANRILAQHLA